MPGSSARGDRIFIEGLRVGCIVGVRPQERGVEQPVDLDVEMFGDLRHAGRTGRISATCDYDVVAEEVGAMLRFRRFRLLEAAAEEVAAMLLGVHPGCGEVKIRISKPRALDGRARGAGVEIQRSRNDFPRRREVTDFGSVEVILETEEAGLYLLHVDPGRSIPPHRHYRMRELEWRVCGDLERNGVRMAGLGVTVWGRGRIHGYRNAGRQRATLFCCDVPPFLPEDEVRVGAEEGGAT